MPDNHYPTRNRRWEWFIHPGDDRTNEILGKMLDSQNAYIEQLCEDGVKRHMYCCPNHEFVLSFTRTANHNSMPFKVFVREGPNSKIRSWKFGERPKKAGKSSRGHVPRAAA